jgi:outer membrane protein assembly factor BamB
MNPEQLGAEFLSRYRIERALDSGDEPSVYLAHQVGLDRPVALKFFSPGTMAAEEALSRFLAEARLLGQLRHQNVVEIYDVVAEPVPYVVMEHVDGSNLRQILARRGPLPLHDVFSIILQVCDGLVFIHERGVIHGNLKPENILVDRSGWAKITDLGLASHLLSGERIGQGTGSGLRIGTPAYMAPELVEGRPGTPQTDLYALGVVLYELLVGHPPFVGDTPLEVCRLHLAVPPPPIRGLTRTIPIQLEEVVRTALAKTTGRRYPDVNCLRLDLQDLALFAQLWIDDYVPSAHPTEPERFPVGAVTLPVRSLARMLERGTSGAAAAEPAAGPAAPDAATAMRESRERAGTPPRGTGPVMVPPILKADAVSRAPALPAPPPAGSAGQTLPLTLDRTRWDEGGGARERSARERSERPSGTDLQRPRPEVAPAATPASPASPGAPAGASSACSPPRPQPPLPIVVLGSGLIGLTAWLALSDLETIPGRPPPVAGPRRPHAVEIVRVPGGVELAWNTAHACPSRVWYQRGAQPPFMVGSTGLPATRHRLTLPASALAPGTAAWVHLGGSALSAPIALAAGDPLALARVAIDLKHGAVVVRAEASRPCSARLEFLPGGPLAGEPAIESTGPAAIHAFAITRLAAGEQQLTRLTASTPAGERAWSIQLVSVPAPRVEDAAVRLPGATALASDGRLLVAWDGLALRGVEPAGGKVVWTVPDIRGPGPAPVVRQGAAVAATADGELIKVDLARGEIAWRARLGPGSAGDPAAGRIAADAHRAYVATRDGAVLAHRLEDGSRAWMADLGGECTSGPLLAGTGGPGHPRLLWVGRADGQVRGFDPDTGIGAARASVPSRPDQLLVAGDRVVVRAGGSLVALEPSGRPAWTAAIDDTPPGAPGGHAGALGAGPGAPGLAGSDAGLAVAWGPELRLLDPATGRPLWTTTLGTLAVAAPVIGEYAVYVAGSDGTVRAHDLRDGGALWQAARSFPARLIARAGGVVWYLGEDGALGRIHEPHAAVAGRSSGSGRPVQP